MQIGVDSEKAVDNKRLFVVDTDEITRAALQFMLHDENETHEMPSLEAAYVKALDWKPDGILLGIGVVRERGVETLAEIRSRLPEIKILLIAESASDPLARSCLQNGVNAVLAKPLTIEAARRKVDALLGRRVKLAIPVVQA